MPKKRPAPAWTKAQDKAPERPSKDSIIISVDFGTTFSGVAWHHTASDKPRPIMKWPPNARHSQKVPTVLAYNEKDVEQAPKWGFDIPNKPQWKCLQWFKLLLNESYTSREDLLLKVEQGLKGYPDDKTDLAHLRTTIQSMPDSKKPVDLAADFLCVIYQYTKKSLVDAYSELEDQLGTKEIPLTFYLTVPAIWDEKAKELTREAAMKAGMMEGETQVQMISEPEAAAVHCLKDMKLTKESIKVDDVYVITDCGGGTVDLISYQVTATLPTLKVKECTVGTGGLCGSTSINRRFEARVKERIGQEAFDAMSEDQVDIMRTEFDWKLKCDYIPPTEEEMDDEDYEEQEYSCQLPGVSPTDTNRVRRNAIWFTQEEMQALFEPTFREITDLVQKQVTKAEEVSKKEVKAIVLVGGFGSSTYLARWLEEHVRNTKGNQVKILRPDEPALAIVLGALEHGVAIYKATNTSGRGPCEGSMIESRKARCHYGIPVAEPFIPRLHPRSKCVLDPLYGIPMCIGRMRWFIKKGEDMYEGNPKKIECCRRVKIPHEPSDLIIEDEIYHSTADNAPMDVEYTSVLGKYKVDLRNVPRKGVFTKTKGVLGTEYWEISSTVLMTYKSARLEFRTECGGKTAGEVTMDFNHAEPENKEALSRCTCGASPGPSSRALCEVHEAEEEIGIPGGFPFWLF